MAVLFLSCNFSSWYLFIFIIFFGHEIKIVVVVVVVGPILQNFRKSSESGRKSSENHQKRRHQYFYTAISKKVALVIHDA